jgi:hypothetical protein
MPGKKPKSISTGKREKVAVWLDHHLMAALREYQVKVGVPVSESIRRAIAEYIRKLI